MEVSKLIVSRVNVFPFKKVAGKTKEVIVNPSVEEAQRLIKDALFYEPAVTNMLRTKVQLGMDAAKKYKVAAEPLPIVGIPRTEFQRGIASVLAHKAVEPLQISGIPRTKVQHGMDSLNKNIIKTK